MKEDNKCDKKRCRGEAIISIYGKWLCERHWNAHCKDGVKKEERK